MPFPDLLLLDTSDLVFSEICKKKKTKVRIWILCLLPNLTVSCVTLTAFAQFKKQRGRELVVGNNYSD